jgi:general secretion pathway protein D
MRTRIHDSIVAALALVAVLAAQSVGAQDEKPPLPARAGAVPIETVIAAVAKRTGKKFVLDPRVRGEVSVIGQESTSVDYDALLSILRLHGFATVDEGGYVRVIPDMNIRQQPLPVSSGKEAYADGEYVNRLIHLKSAPAAHLVPILRPLLPQHAHLVALPCKNALLVTDTFGSVKRIEEIARALDAGDPYTPPSCAAEWVK